MGRGGECYGAAGQAVTKEVEGTSTTGYKTGAQLIARQKQQRALLEDSKVGREHCKLHSGARRTSKMASGIIPRIYLRVMRFLFPLTVRASCGCRQHTRNDMITFSHRDLREKWWLMYQLNAVANLAMRRVRFHAPWVVAPRRYTLRVRIR